MGEDDGRLFMVMELLQGDPLNDYLKRVVSLRSSVARHDDADVRGPRRRPRARHRPSRHQARATCSSRRTAGLKILDFGVARLANSSMTASGFIVGTPDFMSPEQARGKHIDQRSDVFSAGAVFYYMLSGRKPFAAPDLPAVLHKVEAEDPVPPAERGAGRPLARSSRRRWPRP